MGESIFYGKGRVGVYPTWSQEETDQESQVDDKIDMVLILLDKCLRSF